MQLPHAAAATTHRLSFSIYLARRLRRAKLTDQASSVSSATQSLLELSRAWEDLERSGQEALADRDSADDDIDRLAQDLRFKLASRSRDAVGKAPYTLIFPEGIRHYLEAPFDEQNARYTQLSARLVENLAEDDPVRTEEVPKLEAALTGFNEAVKALEQSRNAETRAKDQLRDAEASWKVLMEQVYGALVSQVGRKEADRYFPKVRRRTDKTDSETAPDTGASAP